MHYFKIRTEYSFGGVYAKLQDVVDRLKELGAKSAAIVDVESTWGHVKWQLACRAAGIKPMYGVSVLVGKDDTVSPRYMSFIARNQDGLEELYRSVSKAHYTPYKDKRGDHPRMFYDDVLMMSDNIVKFADQTTDKDFLEEIDAIIDYDANYHLLNALKDRIGGTRVDATANLYPSKDLADVYELMTHTYNPCGIPYISSECLMYPDNDAALSDSIEDFDLPVAPDIKVECDIEKTCRDGIAKRGLKWDSVYEQRLMMELNLIKAKHFDSYFAIVSDMVLWAKENMLVGPSRGSSAGSLVCYLMGITEIDPLPPQLLFERFLDITRKDLPDVDIDFPDGKRDMVYGYMKKKYGNVSRIGSINKIQELSVLNMLFKDCDVSCDLKERVRNNMVEHSSGDSRYGHGVEDTLRGTTHGQELVRAHPIASRYAMLEHHATHTGIHAAGMILYPDNMYKYSVVDADGIAHIDKHDCHTLGLLKIDCLSLKTLSILEDSGVDVDWYNLPLDDDDTYQLFRDNHATGVFQFDGNALKSLLKSIKPTSITQIDAITALARPGPFSSGITQEYIARMNGKSYAGVHPKVDELMESSYGLPIYQEQTMMIVKEIASFCPEDVSEIRNSISKSKGQEYFNKFWPIFHDGAVKNGYSEEVIKTLWNQIATMGAWQMNKSHTYSYAVLAYWTAWLKTHHPAEFTCSVLKHSSDDNYSLKILEDYIDLGGKFVPFDPMKSDVSWSTDGEYVYGGYTAVKGIGEKKAAKYIQMRAEGRLSPEMCDKLMSMDSLFQNVEPFHRRYKDWYEHPEKHNVSGRLTQMSDLTQGEIPHMARYKFIGRVDKKDSRDLNEASRLKKRGGVRATGQTQFVDFQLYDGDLVFMRIPVNSFRQMGKKFMDEVSLGDIVLVEAVFYNGNKFGFVTRWKKVDCRAQRN